MVEGAKKINADRIELFTGPYAKEYNIDKFKAVEKYIQCSKVADEINIDVNAGHDLNQDNLRFFIESTKNIKEVSIGHALITESLYNGLKPTIKSYLDILK
jgi:pyridoxine 5-phosphate synthase